MTRHCKRFWMPLFVMLIALLLASPAPHSAYAQTFETLEEDAIASFRFESEKSYRNLTYFLGYHYLLRSSDEAYYLCYHDYVMSRIVPLEFPAREPEDFGPWSARKEYGAADAAADGSLTEWADNYYITHDWSDYGQEILTICPDDTVSINGRTFTVEDAFCYPKDGYLEEVRDIVGEDTIVVQTCEPSSTLNRIVYGRPV